jgi:hypothetical protein
MQSPTTRRTQFLLLTALMSTSALALPQVITSWTRSTDSGTKVEEDSVAFSDRPSMEQKLEVIRGVVKTDEISTSEAQPAAKIRLAAREADLGVWLVKTLDDREPGDHGYAYVMPKTPTTWLWFCRTFRSVHLLPA